MTASDDDIESTLVLVGDDDDNLSEAYLESFTSEEEGAYTIRNRQPTKELSDIVFSSTEYIEQPPQPPPGKHVLAIIIYFQFLDAHFMAK